jgi:regulator of nonsense transcripts 3
VSTECVSSLSDTVRQASFQDARNTIHDPILLGPPSLEFAPYAKTPGSRSRKDARQGTIDQDSDFIAFLESLTQPITRPAAVDSTADGEDKKKEAVMTTPLVQFIKDKKASKAKDGLASKSKHGRSDKESKQEKVQAKKLLQRGDKESAVTSTEKKAKGEKTGKDSAKTSKHAAAANAKGGKSSTTTTSTKEVSAAPERKRERGNVAAATKILQRDLGLTTSGGRRRGKGGSTDTATPKNESSRDSSVLSAEAPKRDTVKQPKGSSSISDATKSKDCESSSRVDTAPAPPTKPPAKSTRGGKAKALSTAKQAFLKHANPSQGVTEALLESAFASFGAVTKVEIDKKKGFGYVDFAEPEGLRKAIAASPVSVAQSQVVVLERKENPGIEKSRKGREASVANKAKAATEAAVGAAGAGGTGSNAAGNAGSSRGSRGGRGSRHKGPKGGAGAGASEKSGGAEAK